MDCHTRSEQETRALGARLGAVLSPGAVVACQGGLGMGKTAFAKGVAAGLGYQGPVTSPTFTIVNEYLGGRLALFHFDLYRLAGPDELLDIGWEEYLDRGGVCLLEWSERIGALLPPESVIVRFHREGETLRRITVQGVTLP